MRVVSAPSNVPMTPNRAGFSIATGECLEHNGEIGLLVGLAQRHDKHCEIGIKKAEG